jgi:hypothetical protein
VSDTVQVVDGSYHRLTATQAQRLKAAGVVCWAQCLWTGAGRPLIAQENLDIAEGNGLLIAGYGSLPTGAQEGVSHATHTIETVRPSTWDRLRFAATDVELNGIANGAIRQMLDGLKAAGKAPLVYTSLSCWRDKQGNPSAGFEDAKLWNASWNGSPDGPLLPARYGPWAEAVGRQWSGGVYLEEAYVDRNTFVAEFIKEETMPDLTESQQLGILAVFCAASVTVGRPLAGFFDPLPAQAWADAWKWIGVSTPPPQPELTYTRVRGTLRRVSLEAPVRM